MASTNKTTNLGLNAWLGTDHPTRSDFVQDNTVIDEVLGEHTANSTIHLTSSEKTRVSNPIYISQYIGTGTDSTAITLDVTPKFVIVHKKNSPPVAFSSTGVVINAGMTAPYNAGTNGLSLTSNILTVSYSATMTDGARPNFNEESANYVVYSFR